MAVITQEITERYAIYNGDCCEVVPKLKTESVHLSVYSPPFSELYQYSSSSRDMSNCASYEQFCEHYEFLVKEIARVTKPGRMSCVHCMDLRMRSAQRDFPGDVIRIHAKHGFDYVHRYVIWKEPLKVAIRTRSKHLMHKQVVKDSTLVGCAGADYVLVFRRTGENKEPVTHATGFTEYAGQITEPTSKKSIEYWFYQRYCQLKDEYAGHKNPKTNKFSHWIFQQYASSVWMDIRGGHVLPYKPARETDSEKHVCPLQLDVIDRCISMYSNPDDVVLTPFLGVGSEAFCAVRAGRRAIGIDLKPTYFEQASRNIKEALKSSDEQKNFFDAIEMSAMKELQEPEVEEELEEQPA